MKQLLTIISFVAIASCTPIDSDNYLTEVELPTAPQDSAQTTEPIMEPVPRNVLIEDFTGQRCSNCPEATELIETLVSLYGENRVIGVGIHCNPLGFEGNAKNIGLMNMQGMEYGNTWNVNSQPIGMINRTGGLRDRTEWTAAVSEELSKNTPVSISIVNTFTASTSTLDMEVGIAAAEDIDAMLQLWLVEDGIVAMQMVPSGDYDREYVHQHVFREAINGLWGENIAVAKGQLKNLTYTYTFNPEAQPQTTTTYVPHNCAVVAFVYNSGGSVLQVTKRAITE